MTSILKLIDTNKYHGKKVKAIKLIRNIFGVTLQFGKEIVEDAVSRDDGARILVASVIPNSRLTMLVSELQYIGLELKVEEETGAIVNALKKAAIIAVEENNFAIAMGLLDLAEKALDSR